MSPYNIHTLSSKQVMRIPELNIYITIYHKILETNLQGNKKQLEGRIDNQILGVKQFKITTRLPTADKQNQPQQFACN